MSHSAPESDARLVAQAREGDTRAFGELLRSYEGAAIATAMGVVSDRDDARDVVQDAFLLAWIKLGQLREPEQFGWWLRSIVRRRAIDRARKRREDPITGQRDETGYVITPVQTSARTDRTEDLWDQVARLPAMYREVVILHYVHRHPYERIGRYTGVPVSTVRGRLRQARLRLKESLLAIEGKEDIMKDESIIKSVAETICSIHRESVDETAPMNGKRNFVIFAGIAMDLEVCTTDGDSVVITGAKAAAGLSEEDARRRMEAVSLSVSERDKADPEHVKAVKDAVYRKGEVFPAFVADDGKLADDIMETLKKAVVLDIRREGNEPFEIPGSALTDSVWRAAQINSSGGETASGWSGYVDLVVAVPVGVHVTILRDWAWGRPRNLIHGLKGASPSWAARERNCKISKATCCS